MLSDPANPQIETPNHFLPLDIPVLMVTEQRLYFRYQVNQVGLPGAPVATLYVWEPHGNHLRALRLLNGEWLSNNQPKGHEVRYVEPPLQSLPDGRSWNAPDKVIDDEIKVWIVAVDHDPRNPPGP